MGWGFDYLCWPWGKAFDQYNLVLPGEGIFESLFARCGPDVGPTWARRGPDVGKDLTADSDERD